MANYSGYRPPQPKAPKPPRVVSRVRQPTTRPKAPSKPRGGAWSGWYRPPTVKAPKAPAGLAATAPAAAPAGLGPLPTGLPVDPTYDSAVAGLARKRDDTLAQLAQQRTQGFQDYGYNPTLNAQGGIQSLAFDPSNPYSQAALMKKNYEQGKAANTTGMAARGQLYSGALGTAQDVADQGYGQNTDNLQKRLINMVARNAGQQTQARTGYEEGVSQAAADRLGRAADSPLYDPDALAALQDQIDKATAVKAANAPAQAASAGKSKSRGGAWSGIGNYKAPKAPKPAPKRPAPRAPVKPRVSTKPKSRTRK